MRKEKEPKQDQQPVETPAQDAGQEARETAAQEQETLPEEETEAEIPQVVELKREEFLEVKNHIVALEKERDEMKALAQRVQADFDNFRRRNATIMTDCREEGMRNCIRDLLPVLDNFDRAMDNAENIDESWLSGIKLVQRQLLETLGKCGLKEVPADGQFDPNLHEAVMQEEVEGMESGKILQVFQKGYQVNDRIIRHSMVKVAK